MLRRPAQILVRRVGEIELAHQMVGLVRLGGKTALVEIRGERVVAGAGKAVGNPADLVVEPPPFLDHHDAGATLPSGREIALGLAAVRSCEIHHRAHFRPPAKP
jgi:hypothetical protein